MSSSESSITTSGGCLPPKSTPLFEDHVVDTLTDEVRRIFYRYDCQCVPLLENQLGVYRACEELTDMPGLKFMSDYSVSQTPISEPVTPAVDPSLQLHRLLAHLFFRKSVKVIKKVLHWKSRFRPEHFIRDKLSYTTATEFSLI